MALFGLPVYLQTYLHQIKCLELFFRIVEVCGLS